MKIYALVITRPDTPDEPELADAWDAKLVEINAEGYAYAKHRIAGDLHTHAFAEVLIDIPDHALITALYPKTTVVQVDHTTATNPPPCAQPTDKTT